VIIKKYGKNNLLEDCSSNPNQFKEGEFPLVKSSIICPKPKDIFFKI
jgi:hypothetical protein